MLGNIVLAGVSWLLFYFVLKQSLVKAWFTPLSQRLNELGIGVIIAIASFAIPLFIKSIVFNIDWSVSESINISTIAQAFYFYLKSVLFEELIFRGALLAVLIHFTSNRTAILISAISFGVYHWFSYGMFGSGLVPMTYIFFLTGSMGLVWAFMYSESKSILLPIVAHLSWNFQSSLFTEYQPFGHLILTSETTRNFSELIDFGIQTGGYALSILLMYGLYKWYLHKSNPPDGLPV